MKNQTEQVEKRRAEWDYNHELILEKYWELRTANPLKRPTNKAIAEAAGVSITTVTKHLDSIDLSKGMEQHKKYRDDVVYGLALKGMQGDSAAARLYFEITFGWVPKQEVKQEVINKTLQINFTSDLDKNEQSGSTEPESENEIVE